VCWLAKVKQFHPTLTIRQIPKILHYETSFFRAKQLQLTTSALYIAIDIMWL